VKKSSFLNWLAMKGPPFWLAFLAGLALFIASGSARADFKLYVFDDNVRVATFSVASGGTISTGAFDTPNFHVGREIAPGVTLGIVAMSNSPGSPQRSFVDQLTFTAVNTSSGVHTLTVSLSDVGFNQPNSPTLVLRNAANVTWGPVGTGTNSSDTLAFTSFVNTNNKPFDADVDPTTPGIVGTAASGSIRSTTVTLMSPGSVGTTAAGNSPDVFFPKPPGPYSISDELGLTLAPGSGVEVFGATNVFPTPAPSSWVALATGIPVVGLLTLLRRRPQTPAIA
jgi:hypothetical protein